MAKNDKNESTGLGWHEDLLASMIGHDDGTFRYVMMRAFFIGIVLNPLIWLIGIGAIIGIGLSILGI